MAPICPFYVVTNSFPVAARKTDIVKMTECILDAINSGDFETYTYVFIKIFKSKSPLINNLTVDSLSMYYMN